MFSILKEDQLKSKRRIFLLFSSISMKIKRKKPKNAGLCYRLMCVNFVFVLVLN